MNLANKLTLLRVVLVPFFVVFMLVGAIPMNLVWAMAVFAAASLTDMLDGKIARKYNMITNFGKFLDPLADKVLVISALICMVELGWTSSWLVAIIVAREFMVSGVRLLVATSESKTVVAASIWGKLKTAATMVAIVAIMLMHIVYSFDAGILSADVIQLISDILMYISAALTVISGVQYLWAYRGEISSDK